MIWEDLGSAATCKVISHTTNCSLESESAFCNGRISRQRKRVKKRTGKENETCLIRLMEHCSFNNSVAALTLALPAQARLRSPSSSSRVSRKLSARVAHRCVSCVSFAFNTAACLMCSAISVWYACDSSSKGALRSRDISNSSRSHATMSASSLSFASRSLSFAYSRSSFAR